MMVGNDVLEAWVEVLSQTALTASLGQIECGYTTHRYGDCDWCGARV